MTQVGLTNPCNARSSLAWSSNGDNTLATWRADCETDGVSGNALALADRLLKGFYIRATIRV